MNLVETVAYQQMGNLGKAVDHYGGPMGLAGKLVGLGIDEIEEGIPGWAWFGVGALAGGILVFKFRSRLERVMG